MEDAIKRAGVGAALAGVAVWAGGFSIPIALVAAVLVAVAVLKMLPAKLNPSSPPAGTAKPAATVPRRTSRVKATTDGEAFPTRSTLRQRAPVMQAASTLAESPAPASTSAKLCSDSETPSTAKQPSSNAHAQASSAEEPSEAEASGLACPEGFDAKIFAELPPLMQREAILAAARKAKSDKAAAARAAKAATKSKQAKKKPADGGSLLMTPAESSGSEGSESTTEICGITVPAPMVAATPVAKALNRLLEELRETGVVMEGFVASDETKKMHATADNLMKLQIKFDNIEPDGNGEVRAKRKECVKSLNALLDVAEAKGWKTAAR